MNDEIKEILDGFDKCLKNYELDKAFGQLSVESIYHLFPHKQLLLKDYITNLQQENEYLKKANDEKTKIGVADHKYASQMEDKIIELQQENKILKKQKKVINRHYIKRINMCIDLREKCKSYQLIIYKAIKYIKENKVKVYAPYGDNEDTDYDICLVEKEIDNLLNILRGSDKNV